MRDNQFDPVHEHCGLWISESPSGTWSIHYLEDDARAGRYPIEEAETRNLAETFAYGYMVGAGANR